MIKRKRKAFTIVELVIVIAVIAILAAVLIPTFASIINKANESADIQAVRQMNMALLAESAVEKPTELKKVIEILDKAGYNSVKNLTPVSKDHGFYWHSATNTILLVKDPAGKSAELIYPLDNQTLTSAFDAKKTDWTIEGGHADFYDLEDGEEYLSVNTVNANASNFADIQNALNSGKSNVVININSDITVSEALTIGENLTVTFNLNGSTLTIGGTEQSSAKAFYSPSASLDASGAAAVAEEPSYPSISVSGTLNINGGKIDAVASNFSNPFSGLVVQGGGTLNLNNTDLDLIGDIGIKNSGGTVTINGGNFTAVGGSSYYNLLLANVEGTMTVTEASFKEEEEEEEEEVPYYYYGAPIYSQGGTIDMENVKIFSSQYCTVVDFKEEDGKKVYGEITIDENSFLNLTGEGEKNVAPCGDYNAYNAYYVDAYSYLPTDNKDNDFFEYSGNSIDTTGFFFELKAACEKGETIDLEADFELNHLISVAKTTTINLCNNAELTINPYYSNIGFNGSGTLNITGNGTVILDKFVENCFDFNGEGKVNIVGDTVIDIKVKQNPFTELFTALDRGYEFKNCTLTYSSIENIAVNEEGVISLKSGTNPVLDTNLSVPEGKTVTINLNGQTLNSKEWTITVPNNSTLNIVNRTATTSQIKSSGNTNIFNVQADGNLNLGKVEDGNLNLGKVELVNMDYPAYFLSYIMNNSSITASDVSIEEGKATLNKSIAEDGKITNTLTLTGNLTLGKDLTVSGNNTLEIVFNNYSLNSYDYAIIVKDGGKLIVNAQTVKGTGSFTVESGGTIEISNNSTINKAITVNKGTLTVSDSTVSAAITAYNASKVTFTNVDVKMSQADFFNLLTVVMESNDSTMTNVKFYENSTHYLTVTKAAGKETDILLINTFTLSQPLTIPVGCDVTLDMYHREIQIGATLGTPVSIEVNGTLTIDGGNIRTIDSSKITVTATGKLVLNAKNYYGTYDSSAEFLGCVTVAPGGTVYICGATADVIKSYVVGILNGSISATNATFADADGNTTTVSITDGVVTITLGSNIDLRGFKADDEPKKSTVIINLNGKTFSIGSDFGLASGSTLTINGGGTFVYGEEEITVNADETYTVNSTGYTKVTT